MGKERLLADSEIQLLINDEKLISAQEIKDIRPTPKNGRQHTTYMKQVISVTGRKYSLRVRTNVNNVFDFSVILSYYDERTHKWYILRRYNGCNHTHTNHIERIKISRRFHIHKATEIYQREEGNIVGYAEETDAYTNWKDALRLMLHDCNFTSIDAKISDFGE